MSGAIKLRLAAFVLAIVGMVALIAWAGQSAWRRGGDLQESLNAVQLQSFQIATRFQQSLLELDNVVLRYGVYHNSNDWSFFLQESKNLDKWLDERRPILSTLKEKLILDQINTNYDYYMAAALAIKTKVPSQAQLTTPLVDFADFEKQGRDLLQLGFALAEAHRESMDSFLADSNKSLNYLRWLLEASLGLLLLAVVGLTVVVYRELIAPLRVKLVESQEIIGRQEKLASLGMLAAGVAHEIRNPLTAIKAWLYIQQKHLRPGTPEHADAEIIANEVIRLERIVKDVLLFARPSEPHFVTLPADEPLRQVATLLRPQLERANIRFNLEDSGVGLIHADPQQIQQVLINLVQNAADSMVRGGVVTLRVRTATKKLSDRPVAVAILEVTDTGKGIPPEVEKRLFDPFFTTKESGTGLGLAIAARIIEKHGGSLQYQTQLNRGTTFGVVLPLVVSEV